MKSHHLVDVNEAMRLTGLQQHTLYKLARQRRLRTFRVLGRAIRFDRDDLLGLVREQPAVQACEADPEANA